MAFRSSALANCSSNALHNGVDAVGPTKLSTSETETGEAVQPPLAAHPCCWPALALLACALGHGFVVSMPAAILASGASGDALLASLVSACRAARASVAAQRLRSYSLSLSSWSLGMEVALLGRQGVCDDLKHAIQ